MWGDEDDLASKKVAPDELPKCDVLISDCEGAEKRILEELDHRPKTIIVETHGDLGAPEVIVTDRLNEMGCEIINREVEVEDEGIVILTGERINS